MSKNSLTNEPNTTLGAVRTFTDGSQPVCSSLGEIRERMDDLDAKVIVLLAERAKLARDAARFKKDPYQVTAPARQEEVFAKVRALAEAENSPMEGFVEIIDKVYRLLVTEYIAAQQIAFKKTKLIDRRDS